MGVQVVADIALLRSTFSKGITRPLDYRLRQLAALATFLVDCEKQIEEALYLDLRKSKTEAFATEIALSYAEIELARKKLKKWMAPRTVSTSLIAQPGFSRIYPEPLGVVLVIAPWNYPLQLLLVPLIGAIAAGNAVVLKPSEMAPATSKLLAESLPRYLDPHAVMVVQGGVSETTELLTQPFDHIFYTGSGSVGRIVMAAAAKHLTPITLELGGKSPCIVDKSADINVAARRIVWGKFTNAGQTCIAPDYVLAHESIEEPLAEAMKQALLQFYGEQPQLSPNYGRIINLQHHQRLVRLLPTSEDIFVGGQADVADLYIAPTLLRGVTADAPVMADEIFGPLLPLVTIKDIDAAIQFVNARPKPLASYVFASDKSVQQQVLHATSSGSVCINHTLMQNAVTALPFGGVGASGMGAYHGKATFNTFSHFKSVLTKPTWPDPDMMYPPYGAMLKRILKWLV